MKSGKAQEGTVSAKRETAAERRSKGKGEAWEREKHGKRRSKGKGEAEAK